MKPDVGDDSAHFGLWPTVIGMLAGFALVALMFALATGMR